MRVETPRLFSPKTLLSNPRSSFKARKLMKFHDFGCFSETHGVAGRDDANKCPQDIRQFWSNGITTQGGIGLWIKKPFLAKLPNWSWEEHVADRVAVLRLGGAEGHLDISYVYLDTNFMCLLQGPLLPARRLPFWEPL